jgi:hypothetical protein
MAFVDAIAPVSLSLRGNSIHARSAPIDTRHRRQYRNEHDTTGRSLRRTAQAAQQHAHNTIHAKPKVTLRPDVRQTINAGIHEYQRDQKALVLSLREVETALGKGKSFAFQTSIVWCSCC